MRWKKNLIIIIHLLIQKKNKTLTNYEKNEYEKKKKWIILIQHLEVFVARIQD